MSFLQVSPMGGRKGSPAMKAKMARLRAMRKGGIEVGGIEVGGYPVGGAEMMYPHPMGGRKMSRRRKGGIEVGGAEHMLVSEPMADFPRVGAGRAGRVFMHETRNPDVGGRMCGCRGRMCRCGGISVGGFKKGEKATEEQKERIKRMRIQNASLRAEGLMKPRKPRGEKKPPLSSVKQVKTAIKQLLFPSKTIREQYGELDLQYEDYAQILEFLMEFAQPDDPLVLYARKGGKWYDSLWHGIKKGLDVGASVLPFVL